MERYIRVRPPRQLGPQAAHSEKSYAHAKRPAKGRLPRYRSVPIPGSAPHLIYNVTIEDLEGSTGKINHITRFRQFRSNARNKLKHILHNLLIILVVMEGIEPPTRGFSVIFRGFEGFINQSLTASCRPFPRLTKAQSWHTQSELVTFLAHALTHPSSSFRGAFGFLADRCQPVSTVDHLVECNIVTGSR
jgi:hypothetical protein